MNLLQKTGALAADVVRAIRNHRFEPTESGGIYIPGARASIGGVFRHALCPAGSVTFGPWAVDPNRVVGEGLNDLLNVYFTGSAAPAAFYLAPFSGNVTPAAGWTAATFPATATEFTGYTASSRLPWTPAASTAQSVGNTAALAASTLTFAAGGPYNLYGNALLTASAKGATTGKLVAATRFATPRTNMAAGDKLALEYVFTAKDEGDA